MSPVFPPVQQQGFARPESERRIPGAALERAEGEKSVATEMLPEHLYF
jgi:hypothetical protein